MSKPDLDEFATKREVAQRLRVSVRTLDRYIEGGLLPTTKIGPGQQGRVLIRWSAVDKFLKRR